MLHLDSEKQETPIKVRKLGHLVYEVSDIERSTEFWTQIMGFTVSDRNEIGMVFLAADTDHHAIALMPSRNAARPPADAGLQFNHLAMEVDDFETLFRAREFLIKHGISVAFEGRRGPGGNAGLEFTDPDGFMFELYCKMDQVGQDGHWRPVEQFDRAASLEDAQARPLPESW